MHGLKRLICQHTVLVFIHKMRSKLVGYEAKISIGGCYQIKSVIYFWLLPEPFELENPNICPSLGTSTYDQ